MAAEEALRRGGLVPLLDRAGAEGGDAMEMAVAVVARACDAWFPPPLFRVFGSA